MLQDLDEAELDYLGIQVEKQRTELLSAAEEMFEDAQEDKESFSRSSLRWDIKDRHRSLIIYIITMVLTPTSN